MKIPGSGSITGWVLVVALAASVQVVHAGGFYLSEVGSPGTLGTAGAGNVTNNTDPDAAWTNPAGMTGIEKQTLFSGVELLIPQMKFEPSIAEKGGSDGGNAGDIAAIPSFFLVRPLTDKWRFGFSVTAPLGGGFDFGDDFVGRYATSQITLLAMGASPALAYAINERLSIGFGASIIYTAFDMDIAINQGPLPDGLAQIDDATDVGVQGYGGLQWTYSESGARLGVLYRSQMNTELDGDLSITGLAAPFEPQSGVTFEWDNPQLIEVGIRQPLSDTWTLMANVDWEDWSAFADNVLTISDTPAGPVVAPVDRRWSDTYKIGAGAGYQKGEQRFAFGAAYDSSPVDDEDRTIDLPSDQQLRFGLAWGRDQGDTLDWGLATTLLWLGSGKIDQENQRVRFAGEFDQNLIFFVGATIRRIF